MGKDFYVHLTYTGVTSAGRVEWEPILPINHFVGYGSSPEAAYRAARRAMIGRFREKEDAIREAQRALVNEKYQERSARLKAERAAGVKRERKLPRILVGKMAGEGFEL